jgi:TorA maturation chaperone TorD
MVTRTEFEAYLAAGEQTYRFLSQMLLRELNEEAIAALKQQEWPRDTGNDTLDRGYAQVRRYFNFASSDVRGQLAVEYARVFLAAGVYTQDRMTAVPYESVFTGEEHIMMGDARDDVVRRFAADGFKVNPDLHEPEDHLSFELEYLAHMSARAAELVAAGDTEALAANVARQVEFMDKHVLNWVGELHDTAKEYAKTTFYTGMLLVVMGSVEQGRDVLAEVSAQLADGRGLPLEDQEG